MELWQRFRFWYQIQPPVFRMVLAINVVVFLLFNLVLRGLVPELSQWVASLYLVPDVPAILTHPWQLLTYSFFHAGFLHLLFNMLWLYWLGKDLEREFGSIVFAGIYFGGAIAAALLTIVLHAVFPDIGWFSGPVIGASGGVVAVLAAAATFHPNVSITLFLLGRIPLPMLVIGFLVIDFLMTAGSGNNTALGAHWGGALGGYLIARGERSGKNVTSWARVFVPAAARPSTRRAGRSSTRHTPHAGEKQRTLDRLEGWLEERRIRKEGGAGATIHEMPRRPASRGSAEPVETNVDRLLDKISEHGYEALSDEEKQILYEASRK